MKRPRIVVGEDSTEFLQKIISILEVDFEIVGTAGDGKSALEVIGGHKPDLVVLDLSMPILNGIEVVKELAKRVSNLPVVICSVESDPEILEAARRAGAIDYVPKARIERDLVSAVRSALQKKSRQTGPR